MFWVCQIALGRSRASCGVLRVFAVHRRHIFEPIAVHKCIISAIFGYLFRALSSFGGWEVAQRQQCRLRARFGTSSERISHPLGTLFDFGFGVDFRVISRNASKTPAERLRPDFGPMGSILGPVLVDFGVPTEK